MPAREFPDEAGQVWTVWSTYPGSNANVRPQYALGWLTFQTRALRRRLAPIPTGWESADDDQLREYLRVAQDSEITVGKDTSSEIPPHVPETARGEASDDDSTHGGISSGLARIRKLLHGIRIRRDDE